MRSAGTPLSRLWRTTLAAFLVARTVPQLMREQRQDGLWPEGEAASLEILLALRRFGFLKQLLPANE